MTRETKIGLLVGLAFIIVIGILLSDHMTSTPQPPQAALAESASNVRESVTSPAPATPGPTPITSVPQITPANPVLSQTELRPPVTPAPQQPAAAAVTQVHIGGPLVQQPAGTPIAIPQPEPAAPQQPQATEPVKPAQPQQTGEVPVNTGERAAVST